MIVSWYEYTLFANPDLLEDSPIAADNEIINELNSRLDWYEYQEETWLALGVLYIFISMVIYIVMYFILSLAMASVCNVTSKNLKLRSFFFYEI